MGCSAGQSRTEGNTISVKRVYDPPARAEGVRFPVGRLWPRGMRKEDLKLDGWLKDVAPGTELRKWSRHDPARWKEFQERYRKELEGNEESRRPILEAARKGNVTLLCSARDTERNNAVALKAFLEERL
jgi:uncharacterized protein YeaO (DUF488 family)